jgi:hypothetical protein
MFSLQGLEIIMVFLIELVQIIIFMLQGIYL